MPLPLVSIITVVFNAENTIEKTIKSIVNQTYRNIEYIIVDGASSDHTIDIITQYKENFSSIISERDSGLYDAMNKGVSVARGEWVCFMNAGDLFYRDTTVEDVFRSYPAGAQLIYGGHFRSFGDICNKTVHRKHLEWIADPEGNRFPAMRHLPENLQGMWKRMPFSHQSLFARTSLLKKNPFNTRYRIAADYDFIFNRYMEKCDFYNSNVIISIVSVNGLSGQQSLRRTIERWQIVRKQLKSIEVDLYYLQLVCKFLVPEKFKKRFSRIKNRIKKRFYFGRHLLK